MTDQEEKELVIKDKKYVLHYDLVNINNFNTNLLRVNEWHPFDYLVYNISYFVRDCQEFNSYNFPFLLHIKENVQGFFEIIDGKKHLTIDYTLNNKVFLNKYDEIWGKIIQEIKKQKDYLVVNFEKSNLTINFDTENDVPINKMLKFNSLTILIAHVYEIDGRFFHKIFLNECYYTVKDEMYL